MAYYSSKLFAQQQDGLKKDLISCFEFNETEGMFAVDATGLNSGVYRGAYTLNQNGIIGKSLLSTESYILYSTNNRKFTPELAPKSWNCWIRFNTLPSSLQFILALKNMLKSAYQWHFYGGYIEFWLCDGITNTVNRMECRYPQSSLAMSTSVWYMFTVTYAGGLSNSDLKMYFNGNLLTTTNSTVGTYSGCAYDSSLLFSDGLASPYGLLAFRDQLSIFDKELSLSEINRLYNNGNGLAYSNW